MSFSRRIATNTRRSQRASAVFGERIDHGSHFAAAHHTRSLRLIDALTEHRTMFDDRRLTPTE